MSRTTPRSGTELLRDALEPMASHRCLLALLRQAMEELFTGAQFHAVQRGDEVFQAFEASPPEAALPSCHLGRRFVGRLHKDDRFWHTFFARTFAPSYRTACCGTVEETLLLILLAKGVAVAYDLHRIRKIQTRDRLFGPSTTPHSCESNTRHSAVTSFPSPRPSSKTATWRSCWDELDTRHPPLAQSSPRVIGLRGADDSRIRLCRSSRSAQTRTG